MYIVCVFFIIVLCFLFTVFSVCVYFGGVFRPFCRALARNVQFVISSLFTSLSLSLSLSHTALSWAQDALRCRRAPVFRQQQQQQQQHAQVARA